MTHEDLLSHAERVLGQENPTHVDIRRAISSAYYALFHFLLEEVVAHLFHAQLPPGCKTALRRNLDHSNFRVACESYFVTEEERSKQKPQDGDKEKKKSAKAIDVQQAIDVQRENLGQGVPPPEPPAAGGIPAPVRRTLPHPVADFEVSGYMQLVADAFARLYQWRIQADYDFERPFTATVGEAQERVASARTAIQIWTDRIRGSEEAYVFGLVVMFNKKLDRSARGSP